MVSRTGQLALGVERARLDLCLDAVEGQGEQRVQRLLVLAGVAGGIARLAEEGKAHAEARGAQTVGHLRGRRSLEQRPIGCMGVGLSSW